MFQANPLWLDIFVTASNYHLSCKIQATNYNYQIVQDVSPARKFLPVMR